MRRNPARHWSYVLVFLVPSGFALLLGAGLYLAIAAEWRIFEPPKTLGDALKIGAEDTSFRLLAEGADPNLLVDYRHPEINGGQAFAATPLTIAAANGKPRTVAVLIDAGAHPTLPGNEQALCAAVALSHGNVQVLLMAEGADPNPRPKCDGDRRSPLGIARDRGLAELAERLIAAGAREHY